MTRYSKSSKHGMVYLWAMRMWDVNNGNAKSNRSRCICSRKLHYKSRTSCHKIKTEVTGRRLNAFYGKRLNTITRIGIS